MQSTKFTGPFIKIIPRIHSKRPRKASSVISEETPQGTLTDAYEHQNHVVWDLIIRDKNIGTVREHPNGTFSIGMRTAPDMKELVSFFAKQYNVLTGLEQLTEEIVEVRL